jgi:hypothetical protein
MKYLFLIVLFLPLFSLAQDFKSLKRPVPTPYPYTAMSKNSAVYQLEWDSSFSSDSAGHYGVGLDLHKRFYTYDSLGRLIKKLVYVWYSSFTPDSMISFQYDGTGRRTLEVRQFWDTAQLKWIVDYKNITVYSSKRNFSVRIEVQPLDTTINNTDSTIDTIYYSALNIDSLEIQRVHWVKQGWVYDFKTNFYYDKYGNATTTIQSVWDKSIRKWIYSGGGLAIDKFSGKKRISEKSYLWDKYNQVWSKYSSAVEIWTYNSKGLLYLDSFKSTYNNVVQVRLYDTLGRSTYYSYNYYDYLLYAWYKEMQYKFSYDSNGNRDTFIEYDMNYINNHGQSAYTTTVYHYKQIGVITALNEKLPYTEFSKSYPNPVQEVLHVQLTNKETARRVGITLFSVLGKEVHRKQYENADKDFHADIDMNGMLPGVYLLKVEQDGSFYNKKIIKTQ